MRARLCFIAVAFLFAVTLEAQRLPRTVSPQHYDLTFAPNLAAETFDGEETIDVTNNLAATSIKLHAMEITFKEVTIESRGTKQTAAVTPNPADETVTLTVAKPIDVGPATIHISYSGILNKNLKGLYLGQANGRKYASTQFEAAAARYAFPCFDEPEMKATFTVTAIVDDGDLAISNGTQLSDDAGPTPGKRTFKFATTPRMSSYLVALTVGPFDCLKDEADGIPLRVCATRDKLANGKFALEATKAIIPFFNRYYGTRYAFGKLDLVAVPDFAAGAMENTGDIIYRETALLIDEKNDSVDHRKAVASVIAHEIAHQWFGDLVTMKWWNDIWLNEGFATYMAPKPLKAWKPEWGFEAGETTDTRGTFSTDALQTTRAIRTDATTSAQIENMFDAIAYGKTAWMLRMVESYIGEDTARAGISEYIASNAYGNAAAEDFMRSMERASSKPVTEVLSSFIKQPGVPLVTIDARCESGSTIVSASQQRFFSDPSMVSKTSPEVWSIPICFGDQCELLRERKQTFKVKGCEPLFFNRNARGYYITQYSPAEVLRLAKSTSLKPAEKFALLRDEWFLTRSGRRGVDDFLRLAEALRNNREPRVLDQITAALDYIGERLTTPADDAVFRRFAADYVREEANTLGWTPKPDESPEITDLRSSLLLTLGYTGHDRATLDKANELAKRWTTDPSAVDPSLVPYVLQLAALRADPALYDQLLEKFRKSNDAQIRRQIQFAMAKFNDPKLAIRTLEWATTSDIRSQDAGGVMTAVLGTPQVQREAWKYFIANWDHLTSVFPQSTTGSGRSGPSGSLSLVCDRSIRDAAEAAFKAHPAPGTERRVAQALERSAQCIAIRDLQSPKLAQWALRTTRAEKIPQ